MEIEAKVEIHPNVDELAQVVMEDNKLPELLYEIFTNYGWDEKEIAEEIIKYDYQEDITTITSKLEELLYWMQHL